MLQVANPGIHGGLEQAEDSADFLEADRRPTPPTPISKTPKEHAKDRE
jgi:hypothetical protein